MITEQDQEGVMQELPMPTIGRIVHYKLSVGDVEVIAAERAKSGGALHGNPVEAGQVYPMMITRVWGDQPMSAVNGQVLLDGNHSLWVTSVAVYVPGVVPGNGERRFTWPARS